MTPTPTPTMPMAMMMMVMTMSMPMTMRRMPTMMLLHLMLQEIADNSTTKRPQEPVLLLMSQEVSRSTAGKSTSDATLSLGIGCCLRWTNVVFM